MNTTHWHFNLNPNVGGVDKLVRYVVGSALIGVMLVAAPTPVGWVVMLPLIAIPIVISAIISWDPFYAFLQKLPIRRLSSLSVKTL